MLCGDVYLSASSYRDYFIIAITGKSIYFKISEFFVKRCKSFPIIWSVDLSGGEMLSKA